MSNVQGVVQKITENQVSTQYGVSILVFIEIDGQGYSVFTKGGAEELGVSAGKNVRFEYVQKGEYKNIDKKTFQVSSKPAVAVAAAAKSSAPARSSAGAGLAGVKVGHALTNAVQLAIADKNLSIDNIRGRAVSILNLSKKLEENFDSLFVEPEKAVETPQEETHDDGFVPEKKQEQAQDDWDDEVPF